MSTDNRRTRALVAILVRLARPLLRINLAQYKRDVRNAIFPTDAPEFSVPGPNAGSATDRLLFIGDVALAGYGVLRHGMATPSHVARLVAHGRERAAKWATVAATDLTVARASKMRAVTAEPVDAALIMLGIPDVLLATTAAQWTTDLRTLASRIRERSGSECCLIFLGIAPMADFRPIPPLARTLLELQIDQLNRATRIIAEEFTNARYVPFPAWRTGEAYVQQAFSWKSLHEMSAHVLAPATVAALRERPVPWDGSPTLRHHSH